MFFLYQKFISLMLILAIFFFGNMAFVHAEGGKTGEITIEHTHGEIRETHIVETTDTSEPPHCSDSQITSSVIFQYRTLLETPDHEVRYQLPIFYFSHICETGVEDKVGYSQYYPGPPNESFGHLLIGEQILII